jgi:NADP-dependent 3-hydroxy acid dehydrogenase YdfG
MERRFVGKVALVTGATAGIGRATRCAWPPKVLSSA